MKRVFFLWFAAFILTAAFLVWQKMSGPTYPVRATLGVDGIEIPIELLRTGSINEDLPVAIPVAALTAAGKEVAGEVTWRRYPTQDEWRTMPLVLEDGILKGALPRQPMAGKLEYRVDIRSGTFHGVVPGNGEHAVARFKGDVPGLVLVFHVTFLVLGFLFSTGAGLEGLTGGPALKTLSRLCFFCLLVGGLILGPIVQKYAFDAFWTGWPLGEDWTDNKLAVGVAFWLLAVWRTRKAAPGRPRGKWFAVLAMLAIFVIFAIPHSIHGSTYDYATGEHIQRM
ncbi:MAG: hypothetical protein ABIK96_04435 [bacterium]